MQPLRLVELAKGYFPHEFNKEENQNYIGPYPDKKYYGYENMVTKDKEVFDKWYDTVKDQTFDFKKEMYKYCKSDVDILRRSCLSLRELFLQISGIDPFQYITIASVCQAIFRNEYLLPDTIGVINELETDNYSIKSIKWLKHKSLKQNINIKHACNGGEQRLVVNKDQKLKVDGFCAETNTIYQFHGCYFHGCPNCYNDLTMNKVSDMYMYKLYEKTCRIDKAIREAGYNLETIWEHEFDNNAEMKNTSLSEYDLIEPPNIRDSFFGGRCEPIKLLHDCKANNQKGRYIDVVSLYPTVMYYDKYPTGHPTRIIKPQNYDYNWFGFIYCKVVPPTGLYQISTGITL
jgi:G:T-mismatch repair DNA endonuclease (very short patch repair protein)